MKKVIFLVLCLVVLVTGNIYAQEVATEPTTSFVIDLGSFTGIVAIVSALVTQIIKLIPAVASSKLAKIGVSIGVGIIICMLSWLLHLTPLLDGYLWWHILIYGAATGLSGCGFYDVIKALGSLFEDDVIHIDY